MIGNKNILINGANGKPTLIDISYPIANANRKLIIYLHGFKSFKDWGFHPYIATELAKQGFTVVKLNFSHNGVGHTAETCNDFIDLEAFGNNNFSKELNDIEALITFINTGDEKAFTNIDKNNKTIIGHSRGGGMAIIAAEKFACITKLITLNAVCNFDNLLYGINEQKWKESGVHYIANARTNQQMPLYYQFYVDYILHQNQFAILDKVAKLKKPFLCIHAAQDETVKVSHAIKIKEANNAVDFITIPNTGHTFGCSHPMKEVTDAVNYCIEKICNWVQH
jgi:uncharacterized protein